MIRDQLAVQMYTLRDFTKTADGLKDSLEKIHQIGYRALQLSAVGAVEGDSPAVSISECKQMLDDLGIKCAATHRSWDSLLHNTDAEIEAHHVLDCNYTAIGGIFGARHEQGEAGYREFLKECETVLPKLKAAGIRFAYHHHSHEFLRLNASDRRTLFDMMIEESIPELCFELDTYWLVNAGVNPVKYIKKCAGRVPVAHLKDKAMGQGQNTIYAAVGEGNLDWDDILPAFEQAGTEWYCIEQDVCPRDPFDCLRSSFQFLQGR
jgi:sugar phosphate isomerase/epimerase